MNSGNIRHSSWTGRIIGAFIGLIIGLIVMNWYNLTEKGNFTFLLGVEGGNVMAWVLGIIPLMIIFMIIGNLIIHLMNKNKVIEK